MNASVDNPIVASGSALASSSDGVVVGTALRKGGVAGGAIDARQAGKFAGAFRKAFAI